MKNRSRLHSIIVLLFLLPILTLLASRSDKTSAANSAVEQFVDTTVDPDSNNAAVANCRYGTSPDIEGEQTHVIPQLGAGWYLTFSTFPPQPPPDNGADFAHMIFVVQNKNGPVYLPSYRTIPALNSTFGNYIRDNPGKLWIVGNEVDRGPNPGSLERVQGDTFPEIYALACHEVYNFIKANDPTAQVANSGLVQVTPGRLQYLDTMWDTYVKEFGTAMKVDVWTMHVYALPEVHPDGTPNGIANVALGSDPAIGKRSSGGDPNACSDPDVYCFAEHDDLSIFAEQIRAMRQWMANHGQRQKPLIVTEYSILLPYELKDGVCEFLIDENGECFTPTRVSEFMDGSFDYLNSAIDPTLGYSLDNNRMVQQVMWFAVHSSGAGASSNLVKDNLVTLTQIGQTFQSRALSETPYRNLLVDHVQNVAVKAGPGGTATAEIAVTFRNNGNTKVNQPFTVTFYKDAARTMPIDSVSFTAAVPGCTSRAYAASVEWPGLAKGTHQYWVHIDSTNSIVESPSDDTDNIGSGWVFVVDDQVLVPVVRR